MLRNFSSIEEKIKSLIEKLEEQNIEGPIPILEEARDLIDSAIDEYTYYVESDHCEDDYED
jgi:translation initiation factor 2B subunit (eIF-2B alpha/beta/delta family)